MASFNVCSILLILLVTSGAVIGTPENDAIIKKNNCETRMGWHCVMEVFTSIFKIGSVTDRCCSELLVLGNVCHAAFVKRTLENPIFKDLKPSVIITKSIQTWNDCLARSDTPSPPS